MIRVWRLCQAAYQQDAFSGEGARRYGGRWNNKGQPAVYTAATQSLAALEILVHVDTDLAPNDFVVFAVDIPGKRFVEYNDPNVLADDWRDRQPPLACQALGSAWLKENKTPVLAVPSAIIPEETNYILNPRHPKFSKLIISPLKPFLFDQRLWQ